jgi:hypothetical protein
LSEKGWTYSGGGQSFYIAEPAYQKKVAAVNRPCVSQPNGSPYPPGTICRGVPDIADMSGTGQSYELDSPLSENFYDIEQDMLQTGEGGTSLSSPLAVGMWARIQAGAPSSKGLGFANETFYRLGLSKTYKRDFYDVTQSETSAGNFYYTAGPGWDYVSGWGAMDVKNILLDVDHRLTPSHPAVVAKLPLRVSGCAVMTSPTGNANSYLDPVSVKDPELDITTAALHVRGSNLVATISGPTVSTDAPADSSDGQRFIVTWTEGTTTYYAEAAVASNGNVSYSAGLSGSSLEPLSDVQGSFAQHTFTMIVPLSLLPDTHNGTLLSYPYAYDQVSTGQGVLWFTEDVATAGQPGHGVKIGARC